MTKFQCPNCGAKKPLVREEEDKKRPMIGGSGIRTMYYKKMVCGSCAHEWSPDE